MIRFGQPKVSRTNDSLNTAFIVAKATDGIEELKEEIETLNSEIASLNNTIDSKNEEISALTQQLEECQNPSESTKVKAKKK